ncbi:MAG TPA: glycosyltransferase [Solirubrobacteraceae bacterium]|nr:glycosyltransferase [Solirubrobacteraceae bacterium]
MSARGALTPRIRVVTLVDYLTLAGGAERLAVLITTRLDPERFEATLCVSRHPRDPPQRLDESGLRAQMVMDRSHVPVLGLRRRRKLEVVPWLRLARFLRSHRIDVVHSHKFGSNVWGSVVARAVGTPVVIAHEHTWSYEGQPLRRFVDREVIARCADRFIAVSREDQRRMTEVEGIDPERTLFIPNGVTDIAAPTGKDVRAELGITPTAPVVGAVAVLRPQKAQEVLLEAAVILVAKRPDATVLIVGGGPERAALERRAAELGVGGSVRFLGDRADVSDVLAALDVAVCSSDFEGSPLAVMEYMEAAVPIVSTAVGGVPDLIESGIHGLLVPRRDPAAMAAAIEQLLGDPESARAMGLAARERRRAEFEVDVQVRRLEALYEELLVERGRRS